MCKDKTTASYTYQDKSFCYKYELVQYLTNRLGWSANEIANYMNISVASVYAHIMHVRSKNKQTTKRKVYSASEFETIMFHKMTFGDKTIVITDDAYRNLNINLDTNTDTLSISTK